MPSGGRSVVIDLAQLPDRHAAAGDLRAECSAADRLAGKLLAVQRRLTPGDALEIVVTLRHRQRCIEVG